MRSTFIQRGSLGLSIMLACMLAMAAVLVLTFRYQLAQETEQVRANGVNLARLLTRLPATADLSNWQQVLVYRLSDPHFAYGSVSFDDGATPVDVSASGVVVPPPAPLTGNGWLQETERQVGGRTVIEFHGPFQLGDRRGQFRIGLSKPTLSMTADQLPFVASLMLPVFLLTPLFLFFVRREVDPLKDVNAELRSMLKNAGDSDAAPDTIDLRSFADQFNRFVEHARAQLDGYQREKSKLVTSEKFLSYRMTRFEAILDSLPEAVLLVGEDGEISFANARVKSLIDLEARYLTGGQLAVALQHEALTSHFARHAGNLGALVGESLTFHPPHRPELSILVTVHRLRAPAGADAQHYLVVFRDASSEARAQQSRSEFVAHLAHELKAPLNTLSMYAEALQGEDGSSEEFQLEATNVIHDEVERLARLISNLLSMTQIEMGTLQLQRNRIKLADLVRDATQTMERSARGRGLTFELDLPNETLPVSVDKDLLRIAINNLLTNAIKYSDPGGTITVGLSETEDAVTISVADTGIGIAEADQAQIFNKFFRASGDEVQSRGGHGLGLPLARDIVELHHGSMRVESTPGAGSRFYIDLWKHAGVMQQAI